MKRFALCCAAGLLLALATPAAAANTGQHYFDKARQMVAEGATDNGFRLMAAAINMEPDNFVYQTYMLTLLDRTAYKNNSALMEQILAVAPRYVPVMDRLAKLYEGQRRDQAAQDLYEAWRDQRPDQAESYARLGEHHLFRGQYGQAVKNFMAHRRIVGESDYALRRIAFVYDKLETKGDRVMLAQVEQHLRADVRPGQRLEPSEMARLVSGVK